MLYRVHEKGMRKCTYLSGDVWQFLKLHIDTVRQFRTGRKWQLLLTAKPAERRVCSVAQSSLDFHRITANRLGRD